MTPHETKRVEQGIMPDRKMTACGWAVFGILLVDLLIVGLLTVYFSRN